WDNQNRWLSVVESALPWLDFFMPSEAEAALITGESDPVKMAEFLRGKGVKTAIVKLGEKGVYADGGGTERFHLPAFNVPVVDTTGAGDSFTAGFLAKHTQGASLRECARYASAVAAHCVGAVGATAGIPDAETVEEFLIDNF
ncbi:MAG: carbohydrate kinase family protein, partial [Kiritimatiellaeota bacterium]|nr:carbohydrate kinase family protein [Kiritimatiellota bacterium]